MSDDKPVIKVTPQRLMCPGHGEPLRAQWPKGFAVLGLMVVKDALESDALHAAIRELVKLPKDEPLPVEKINEITVTRPFCYFVTREQIGEALRECGLGSLGRCMNCGRSGLGSPYSLSLPMGRQERWFCFECALDTGENMHRAYPDGNVWPTEE